MSPSCAFSRLQQRNLIAVTNHYDSSFLELTRVTKDKNTASYDYAISVVGGLLMAAAALGTVDKKMPRSICTIIMWNLSTLK